MGALLPRFIDMDSFVQPSYNRSTGCISTIGLLAAPMTQGSNQTPFLATRETERQGQATSQDDPRHFHQLPHLLPSNYPGQGWYLACYKPITLVKVGTSSATFQLPWSRLVPHLLPSNYPGKGWYITCYLLITLVKVGTSPATF